MGFHRQHFIKPTRQPRHVRVPLHVANCTDCGSQLQHTHQVSRFGNRCRGCFVAGTQAGSADFAHAEDTASWS